MPTTPTRRQRRDYRAEYQRRIERGLKSGKSRSAARGHARAEDLGPLPPAPVERNSVYEKALRAVKRGASLKSASTDFGLKSERLRRHIKQRTTAKYQGGKWVIFDLRPQPVWLPIGGKLRSVTVAFDDTSDVGRYWAAVSKFLETNDIKHLEPLWGQGVRDVFGTFHRFEVRPNVLRKLDSIGELNFIAIYADVAR
ncbi:hypothetical protein [Brevundimonas sp. TWP2-3-4b2]|uniref:hypothetical protein n=1 Tax=Brevundimonas sp. TWP2-3-4b2 TaxID=2804595 RepID=UPI003CF502F8